MRYKWLIENNNKNIIVFFNGWGMDEKIVSHLGSVNYDVLMFYDYRSFEHYNFDFSKYHKKILICWSMGVFVCNYFYENLKDFDKFIAVNGTQKPIDDNFGIPVMIYNLTVENFNELSCEKFVKKISSTVTLKEYCTRPTKDLKQELISIQNLKVQKYLKFDKAVVSLKDRIIPPKNQINYWLSQNIKPEEIQGAHSIFDKYENWDDLI